MSFISILNDTFPATFPFITRSEIQNKLFFWQTRRACLNRLSFFGEKLDVNEQRQRQGLNQLYRLLPLLMNRLTETPQHIFQIYFACDAIPPLKRISFWYEQLLENLRDEKNILAVLFHLGMNTPLQFAGEILFLLHRKIKPQQLLDSGLLHRFFALFGKNEAEKVYDMLSQVTHFIERENLNELLSLAGRIACEDPNFPQKFPSIALNGSISCEKSAKTRKLDHDNSPHQSLNTLCPVYPLFHFTECMANTKNLLLLFEEDFLKQALLRYGELKSKNFSNPLQEHLDTLSDQKILQLIVQNNPAIIQLSLIKAIESLLSPARIVKLLHDSEFVWFLLGANAENLAYFSEGELFKLCTTPLHVKNFRIAATLFFQKRLRPYLNSLYKQIFDLFFNQPELIQDDEEHEVDPLILSLRHHPEISLWHQMASMELREKLEQILSQNPTFTDETYQQIKNIYETNKTKSDYLSLFHQEQIYPQGVYQLHAFIIKTLFNLKRPFHVMEILRALYHDSSYDYFYTEEEQQKAKYRTLLECLITPNHLSLQNQLIETIHLYFNKIDWRLDKLGNASVLHHALFNGNNLLLNEYFFKGLNESQRWEKILAIDEDFKRQQGESLFVLLAKHKPSAFENILNICPIHLLLPLLLRTEEETTFLHTLVEIPEALHLAMSKIPPSHRLNAVNRSNLDEGTVLQFALYQPASLRYLLKALQPWERIYAINQPDSLQWRSIFRRAAFNLESLSVFFECLPQKDRLTALFYDNPNGDTVLHWYTEQPDVLRFTLEQLTPGECYLCLIKQNQNYESVLHRAIENAESFKIALHFLTPSNVLNALNVKNKKMQTVQEKAFYFPEAKQILDEFLALHLKEIQSCDDQQPPVIENEAKPSDFTLSFS